MKKLLKIRDVKKRRSILEKKSLDEDQIEDILEQVHLQVKGKLKFPRANLMKFTKSGLAQASSKYLAEYRTWKMKSNLKEINSSLDICCGLGGDAIAMALRWKVFAVDIDNEIIQIAKHNLKAYGLEDNVSFIQGDITKLVKDNKFIERVKDIDCIFFDPSRRHEDKRTVKIEEYAPPLSFVEELQKLSPNICVKISPGTDLDRIKYDCDIEVVSYKGEVKEIMLWFGNLKNNLNKNQILATKLPEKITVTKEKGLNISLSDTKKYLYEPDPAFIKAHLIEDLAKKFELNLINRKIAYLTGNNNIDTPFLKKYIVKKVLDINYEEINKTLSELNLGKIDFKSRGVNVNLRNIHKKIKGTGKYKGLVIFTKIKEDNKAILCIYSR